MFSIFLLLPLLAPLGCDQSEAEVSIFPASKILQIDYIRWSVHDVPLPRFAGQEGDHVTRKTAR